MHTVQEKTINLKIAKEDKTRCFVELLNNIFHLTKSEVYVLVAFIQADPVHACSTDARRKVGELLKIASAAVINNHVKALKDKGAISPAGSRRYAYHPLLQYNPKLERITINIQPL